MRELDALSRGHGDQPGDAPPAAVDAAVLARARAAAGHRRVPTWWIPATLAATVVIAFSLMLRVQEDAATVPAAMDAAGPGEDRAAAAAPAAAPASAEVPETSPQVAAQAPSAAPPPLEAASSHADVATLRATASAKAAAPTPDPETWLAEIEALEAAGRTEEAAAERERLEAAYPGWLEQRARGRD
jgi:hypothetical protein